MFESHKRFLMRFANKAPRIKANGMTHDRELDVLLQLASQYDGQSLAEIGTNEGHTSVAMAKACPGSKVFTFDICQEIARKDNPYYNEVLPKDRVGSAIREADESVRNRITSVVGGQDHLRLQFVTNGPYDFIYIDGEHTWRAVANDTRLALTALKAGGCIVWDDWSWCQEIKAFVDILNARCSNEIVNVKGVRSVFLIADEGLIDRFQKAAQDL